MDEVRLNDYIKDIRTVPIHRTFVVASVYQQAARANRDQFHVNKEMITQRHNNVAVRHEIEEESNILN